MNTEGPDFQSVRNIRDTTLLLTIANEYLSEDVFVKKIGSQIKKNLSVLKDDIIALKKQFPGKFTQEVNTDNIMTSFDNKAQEMISGGDDIINSCFSGKLGMSLSNDVSRITEAIEKIWHQVRGSDIQYTTGDSISGFFGRFNIISGIVSLFSSIIKILFILFILLLAGTSYLYFTMEKEGPILKENGELMAYIDEKQALLDDLEKKKADAQKELKVHESSELLRKNKIAILDLETKIQGFNQEIHSLESQIETGRLTMDKNNEKLEKIKNRSLLDRLLKQ